MFKKIKIYWNYLLEVTLGTYGISKIYDLVLAILLLTLGGFGLFGGYDSIWNDILNAATVAGGIFYLLIIFEVFGLAYQIFTEYLSVVLLLTNLVLSLAGINAKTDAISYAVFSMIVLLLKLRAKGWDESRVSNKNR